MLGKKVRYLFADKETPITKPLYLKVAGKTSLKIGLSATPMAIDTVVHAAKIYTTSLITSGTIRSMFIQQTMTVAGNTYPEVLKVQLCSDVKTGGSAYAIFGRIDYLEDGYAHGEGAVICSELSMPSVTAAIRGEYALFKGELDCPTGISLTSTRIALLKLSVWGGGETGFDSRGYLFDVKGVTSGAGKFFYDSTVGVVDGFVKCRINGVDYYLLLADNQT